jgi:hypothetical protein
VKNRPSDCFVTSGTDCRKKEFVSTPRKQINQSALLSLDATKIRKHDDYFLVITAILVADFILERYLDYLNTTRWSDQLPEDVKGIYDEEKYKTAQAFQRSIINRYADRHVQFYTDPADALLSGFALVNNWALSVPIARSGPL